MPKVLKRNAVLALGLAALFYWSFMFAKHDPDLHNIIPFGDDPYDAVGSFAVIIGVLIAMLSFFRAFRPYREAPSKVQRVYLIRSQEAIVLAVLVTLGSDVVAMARHASLWIGAASRNKLIALMGVLLIITAAVHFLIRTAQEKAGGLGTTRWAVPAGVTTMAMLVLAVYPEHLIDRTDTHLFTVVVGAIVLFVPMRLLVVALIPYTSDNEEREKSAARRGFFVAGKRWAIALLTGTLIGAFCFLGEMGRSISAIPSGRILLVASAYIGLGLAGILIAYAFIGEPLGLGSRV